MFSEDEIVMLSALEHYSYCPRQCGLIHIEHVFDENVFTLRGRHGHARAHDAGVDTPRGVRIERSLPLWCERLGVVGMSDVVEFHSDGAVYPVEYKSGARRERKHDDLQVCGQALCLEEMLGREVPQGAIYSMKSKRRRVVELDSQLRSETEEVILAVRAMIRRGRLPEPANDRRCPNCSLIDACIPSSIVEARLHAVDLFTLGPGDE